MAAPWFSIACLVVVMVSCVVGVIALAFYDTFGQRLGMGAVCVGALVKVLYLAQADTADPAAAFVYFGLALYSLATAVKYWWRWKRAGRPAHPFRRSTDFGPESVSGELPAQQRRAA
jgi:hypothetical protein